MKEKKSPVLLDSLRRLKGQSFLFSELVKRDFKKKYKNSYLGMLWSVLSPLLTLLIMRVVFTQFFGRTMAHYTTYLFCGNLIFSYFKDATSGGMSSLLWNAGIFTKINVPKYLFLFSRNVSSLINFGLNLCVFFVFCIFDGISFGFHFLALLYPIVLLVIFNLGIGLILSAAYVFFRDAQYLWDVFTLLLMYMSAIFYSVTQYDEWMQKLFYLNPVYTFIKYFRDVVIDGTLPSLELHALTLLYSLIAFGIGALIYRRCNHKFLYYV